MQKSVFITGAQNGTGYAIAERFAKERWDVFITSRRGEEAVRAAETLADTYGIFAKGYEYNIRNEQQAIDIFRDIDTTGRFVETVVLNAADLGFGTDPAKGMDFWTVPAEEFQRVFETNLVWNFMTIRQAALRMREHHKGSIVFIGSNTAYQAIPNRCAYGASKGGINSFSKSLAIDLGRFGIRSNVVLPGTIKTERWYKMGDKQIIKGEVAPIGDIADFEDVANAAWFLGSDASKSVTGTELTVDGGMSAQLFPECMIGWKKALME